MCKALDSLISNSDSIQYLKNAVKSSKPSNSYLFISDDYSYSKDIALKFAASLLCNDMGCMECSTCRQVLSESYLDLHLIYPASSVGYLISQIKDIISDASVAPSISKYKIFIITEAEKLSANTANALLKTIEEPTSTTVFILTAKSASLVLPTIVSRCTALNFSKDEGSHAIEELSGNLNCSNEEAKLYFELCTSKQDAIQFLKNDKLKSARKLLIETTQNLKVLSDWGVIKATQNICETIDASLEPLKDKLDADFESKQEMLISSALKELEASNKRKISALEFDSYTKIINALQLYFYDVLRLKIEDNYEVLNLDFEPSINNYASSLPSSTVLNVLKELDEGYLLFKSRVSYKLVFETLLFNIKETL